MKLDFFTMLDHALARLHSHGRVTYKTLQLQFHLDDAHLAALKEELLYTHPEVVDDAGRGLIWTGSLPRLAQPHSPPTAPLAVTDETAQASLEAVPIQPVTPARPPPEAERRQLTVLFCDLVGSTQLSGQLDPEDLRAVVRAYQEAAAEAIQSYVGHIAQYLGDGLLVYFGYPTAHEDDARRAVHTGLGIVQAITTLNTRLTAQYSVSLAVRLGIHTGPVVVGVMGSGGRHEYLALGETPNIAARLEGLAPANAVVISAVTARLVQGIFALEDMGTHTLHGVAAPMMISRVRGLLATSSRDEEFLTAAVPVLVGREEESGLLRRRWEQSKAGVGQVVFLSGEAGIGKSALVEWLRAQVRDEGLPRMAFRCSPYHTASALYPVITHLEHLWQFEPDDPPATRLAKLEVELRPSGLLLGEVVPLFAGLLSVPLPAERYAPLTVTPQQQKQQTLDTLVAWLAAEAERQPVLVAWEDLHWADPTTLEVLGLVIEQAPTVPMLHVLTYRPAFSPPWPQRSHMTPIVLNRLERLQVEVLITQQARGKTLPAEVVQHIVAKTDGVPLYVEELTKMLLASALLREEADQFVLTGSLRTVAIPDTLQDALMARLDQLKTAKEVAQIGSVLGREFAYEMLHALVTVDEPTLLEGLAQLVATELLYQRGRPPRATYIFKHALVQDAAYQSLLRRTRQQYHQQVAALLEARFPETVATAPELVAHHYTEAGCAAQALPLWQQAGERALQRFANLEGIEHLTKGLAVLATLPETTDRLQHELDLHVTLGPALMATRGYASSEAEHTFTRAWELCQRLGEPPQRLPVLYGLWALYFVGGKHRQARDQAKQLLHLAQRQEAAAPLLMAHRALGVSLYCMGEVAQAREHFVRSVALYDPLQHRALAFRYSHDLGVAALVNDASTLWILGYPDQALRRSHEACRLAEDLAHPLTLAYAFAHLAIFHQFRRDRELARQHAETATRVSREQGFPFWLGMALILQGWARATRPQPAEQMPSMHEGLAIYRATDAALYLPYFLTLLAETYGAAGQPDAGLRLLDEAHTVMDSTQERFYEAEVHRVQGPLVLAQAADQHAQAETCFQHALGIARRQQARSWELRAAMSLAYLWQQHGKRAEARALLAPVYGWFTEGFDTTDLQEARALLEALA